ncbi:unnamed protein product [Oppiella nova]|uniref:DNA-directed DNA polymerase n=1 Tax=Oppiella nova TaxID=334625 RepID=A0A7R9LSH9_9ACAR|nr:unnamed protein product [Oppiella nova]CAG2166552.1 unnamed protein product [Oppiella nova]
MNPLNHTNEDNMRFNALGIQMLPKGLHEKIFGSNAGKDVNSGDHQKMNEIIRQLKAHGFSARNIKANKLLNAINVDKYLPKFLSNDLSQHFLLLGQQFSQTYKELSNDLMVTQLPHKPFEWLLTEGWTRYTTDSTGVTVTQRVDHPLESDLVFDVEVCMNDSDGQRPTLATAVSSKAWYSWCSRRLIDSSNKISFNSRTTLEDMIPMGSAVTESRLIVGHNISFDRSYIKEQYEIRADKTRFLDTMSLHMCVSGLTQHQRALSYSQKISTEENSGNESHMWSGIGSLNNLVDVYHLYCDDNQHISKDPRNIFIKGSIGDVLDNFQELMTYCANDVQITHKVFKSVYPIYLERFPHPITFMGMLEMSVMYLPVNPHNWIRYVSESDAIYDGEERELNLSLREIANDSCSLAIDRQYASDVWLWDLDWTTDTLRFKKPKTESIRKRANKSNIPEEIPIIESKDQIPMSESVSKMFATSSLLKKVQPLLPGYPKWYLEFCSRFKYDFNGDTEATAEDLEWESGPYRISTQMRSVPKLMRLMWNGYPLHFDEKYGWGYLKPHITAHECPDRVEGGIDDKKNTIYFPMKEFRELISRRQTPSKPLGLKQMCDTFADIGNETEMKSENTKAFDDVIKGCLFYKLPHKGGPDKRVGNPLSKDFLKRVEDGSLTSLDTEITNSVLNQSKRLSYWKNASKRIRSQIVMSCDNGISGAILPRVIVAGTVTRRAVEPTWLTASNVVTDRLGSELKSMIQCPEGYHYVGADVDSQELWIASLIGDSHYSGIHGSTGIGWMTLEGNKVNGTDMHSKTAASINITRDEAKVLNYARIYGAGQPFASRFLMQSNPSLDTKEAKEKAKKIFTETKGTRKKLLRSDGNGGSGGGGSGHRQWVGGTESHMFNKLEEIAESSEPRTPVLGCRISRALEPQVVKDSYMTSRVNWVVQSSGVDFLHIMLVTMKWLMSEMQIDGRFSISIHDELRYLVRSEHRYKAALALQLSNLLTRCLFAHKLGFNDLPLSVAFFSSVDIDKCLRKEVNIDSNTPSNPLGLQVGYGIPFGQSLDILQLIHKIDEI